MLPALIAFWCVTALELSIILLPASALKRVAAAVIMVAAEVSVLWLLFLDVSLFTVLLALSGLYRSLSLLRLIKGRINEKYLRRSSVQTSFWLACLQIIITALWLTDGHFGLNGLRLWIVIAYASAGLSLVLAASTFRHLLTTRPPGIADTGMPDTSLPTLTVAIPARNETDDLEVCLRSLVASDYPKLEILVLDDCSQNKRTPEIIRSFAHNGVRFLQGKVPDDNWLAKNLAYQQLYEAANGELLLFCGVDVRFQPDSLRQLVTALLYKRKSMISLIPRNTIPSVLTSKETTLLQSMRYAWELSLPRRLLQRPPVLSTCWIIKHDVIASAGGFAAVSRSIVPESYFARVSAVQDGYSFMQSSRRMGIVSDKNTAEQWSTAIRTAYPRLHRRIELVMLLSLAEMGGILLPYVLLVLSLLHRVPGVLLVPSAASVVLITAAYTAVMSLTYRIWLIRSLVQLPLAVLLDMAFLHYSMVRYEFFSVIWKGRNVCIPVMRVTDHLPDPGAQQASTPAYSAH